MKTTYNSNAVVFFKTRKLAREYVVAGGKNTSAVIDCGKDKEVGARWCAVIIVSLPAGTVFKLKMPERVLKLREHETETLQTSRWNSKGVHDVKITKKRKFNLN